MDTPAHTNGFDPETLLAQGWTRTTDPSGNTDVWKRGDECFITNHIPLKSEYPHTTAEFLQPSLVDIHSQDTEWRLTVCVVREDADEEWMHTAVNEIHDLFLKPEQAWKREKQAQQKQRGLAEGEKYTVMEDSDWTTYCYAEAGSCSDWLTDRELLEIDTHEPYTGEWCENPNTVVFEVRVNGTANAQRVLDWFKSSGAEVVYAETEGGWIRGNPHL